MKTQNVLPQTFDLKMFFLNNLTWHMGKVFEINNQDKYIGEESTGPKILGRS